MKKEIKEFLRKCAVKTVKAEENTACAWITYQPKVPEAVKKLHKR